MSVRDIQGIPVSVLEKGEGTPIVFLHGWSADHRYMVADFEPRFATHPGWRRYYPDLPGHGRTPAPDWLSTQDQMLDVLVELIDDLVGDEGFALVGSSYGGHTAVGLSRLLRDRVLGVCLVVPDAPDNDNHRDVEPRQVLHNDPGVFADLSPDEEWMRDVLVVEERWMVDELRAHEAPAYRMADYAFLDRLNESYLPSGRAGEPQGTIPCPTLIVTGRQDATVGFRQAWNLLDEFPRATFAVLDVAGHQLGRTERPLLFAALVDDWLDRVRSPLPVRERQPRSGS